MLLRLLIGAGRRDIRAPKRAGAERTCLAVGGVRTLTAPYDESYNVVVGRNQTHRVPHS